MNKETNFFEDLKTFADPLASFLGMNIGSRQDASHSAAAAATPPPAPLQQPPQAGADDATKAAAVAFGPPAKLGGFLSDTLPSLDVGVADLAQGVRVATIDAIEFVSGIIQPDAAKAGAGDTAKTGGVGTDGDDKKTGNTTVAEAKTGAGGGAKAATGGGDKKTDNAAGGGTAGGGTPVTPVTPPSSVAPSDSDEKRRQALYSRQIHYSQEDFKKLGKNHDFKPQRIQKLSDGEDDYVETRLFREIFSSSKDQAKSNEHKPLEEDEFLKYMSEHPFESSGAAESGVSSTAKRESEKGIVAKISKMSLGKEVGGASATEVEKTIEIGNCKINSLRIIDIDDIKTDTKIFISNKGLKELEDYRIELGKKIHDFVNKYSKDQSSQTFKFSSAQEEREIQIKYLFENVESIRDIQEANTNPKKLYDEALKKAKEKKDVAITSAIEKFKVPAPAPAPAPAAGAPPAPAPAAVEGAAVAPAPAAVTGAAVVAGAAVAPAPVAGATLSKEDMSLVNKIADTILQKRLVKGKIGVEKKEGTADEYKESDISSVRISRPKDDLKKIDIEARGKFDSTDLQYVNVCLDSTKGHYVQFQLKGDNEGKAVLAGDDPKYFIRRGNGFEKKEGEKASEIKKTLRKHEINIITTNTENATNSNTEKTLTKMPKTRAFGGIRRFDPKSITRTMIESDKVFVLDEDNSIKIGKAGTVELKIKKIDDKFVLEYGDNNRISTKKGGWIYDHEISEVEDDAATTAVNLKIQKRINPFSCCRQSKTQDNLRLKVFDEKSNEHFELEIKRFGNNYILGGSNNKIKIVGKTTGMPKTIDVGGVTESGSQTPTHTPAKCSITNMFSCFSRGS